MAVHRSGLGRLRSNFTTVLDQQVAALAWLARQSQGDEDLLDALVAELERIRATAETLELLNVAGAAAQAITAATEGGLQDKIEALLEVCRSLDGSRPVFRPLLVLEPDEASAMRLRMRARSCAVQVDFYAEIEELISSAIGDLPFAVVIPLFALDEIAGAFKQDDRLAPVPIYVFEPGGGDIQARVRASMHGAQGWVHSPIDIPALLWRIRQQIGEAEPHKPRLLMVGPASCARIGPNLSQLPIATTLSPETSLLLSLLDTVSPDLLVLDAEDATPAVLALRGHERWHSLPVVVYGDERQAAVPSADLLPSTLDDATLAQQLQGRLERLITQQASALFDRGTGVLSRNALLAVADREVGLSLRTGTPNATCLLELDAWDSFQSTHGSGQADRVLRLVARTFLSAIRETDAVGRVGKSTLALILMACTAKQAQQRLKGIQDAFRNTHADDPLLSQLSFTIGVADTVGGPALLQRAEMALHRARLSGPGSIDS